MAFIRYYVGDIVQMKKSHPCGSDEMGGQAHRYRFSYRL